LASAQASPSPVGLSRASSRQSYQLAKARFDAADYAGAYDIYQTLARGGDNSLQLQLCLGKTLLRLDAADKAIPILSKLIEYLTQSDGTHLQEAMAQAILVEAVLEISQAQASLQGPASGLEILQSLQALRSKFVGTELEKRFLNLQKQLTEQLPTRKSEAPLGTGFLDGMDENGHVHGWAVSHQMPGEPVPVYLFLDGVATGQVTTHQDRPDVTRAGHKGQASGFSGNLCLFKVMAGLRRGATVTAALDPAGGHPLKGQVSLTDADITSLLTKINAAVFEGDLILDIDSVKQLTARLIADGSISAKKQARLMVGTLKHLTLNLQSAQAGQHLDAYRSNSIVSLSKIGSADIELQLLGCMAALDQNQIDAIAVKNLANRMSVVYHESKQNALPSGETARLLKLLGLLQLHILFARLHGLGPADQAVTESLCSLLSQWTQRLTGHSELAMEFLDMSRMASPHLAATDLQQAIKLSNEQGRPIAALCMAIEAMQRKDAGWYVFHQAAAILSFLLNRHEDCQIKFASAVIELLSTAKQLNPEQGLSQKEACALLRRVNDAAMDRSARQAWSSPIQTAVAMRTKALTHLASLTREIYRGSTLSVAASTGTQPTRSPAQRVVFIGSRQLFQCFHYRVQQKMDQLDALGIEYSYLDMMELNTANWQDALNGAAMLMACRVPATLEILEIFALARSLRIPVVYDIDDLIFDANVFPPPLESYAGTIDAALHTHLSMDNPYFSVALSLVDHCVSSTTALAKQIQRFVADGTNVTVLPNLLGKELYEHANADKPQRHEPERLILFYGSATKAHKQEFQETVLPAVLQLLERHRHVDLHLVGYFDGLPDHFLASGRIKLLSPTSDYKAYLELLAQADISIAPLESSVVTDAKSEIKWLEAAAYGVPSVVSPTATYQEVLSPEVNVLFAISTEQWLTQLDRLVTQNSLRQQLGAASKDLALDAYLPQRGTHIMQALVDKFTPIRKQKKRVLLVNVYYEPQSIGGATRVVETQARGLMQYHADEFDVEVLTTHCNPDQDRPYGIDQWYSGDVRVTRLHVPPTDWVKTEDAKIAAFCKSFFKQGQFDLIHLHAVQVLTASVADAALACNIPYVITLHDAWWLSPYLFLIDEKGNAVNPADVLSGGTPNTAEKSKRAARHHRLHTVMKKRLHYWLYRVHLQMYTRLLVYPPCRHMRTSVMCLKPCHAWRMVMIELCWDSSVE
jgi:glycosyltransferase involved in cell wall biosynthesis